MGSVLPLARYLWEVYRELPGNWKQKRRIVAQMRDSIRDYVSEGASVRYEEIVKRFGEPKQIAATYVNEMEAGEVLEGFRVKRQILATVLVTTMVIVGLWIGYLVYCYADFQDSVNGYMVVDVIEVDATNTNGGN